MSDEQNPERSVARPNGFHPGGQQSMPARTERWHQKLKSWHVRAGHEKPKLAKKNNLWKKKFLNTD